MRAKVKWFVYVGVFYLVSSVPCVVELIRGVSREQWGFLARTGGYIVGAPLSFVLWIFSNIYTVYEYFMSNPFGSLLFMFVVAMSYFTIKD